MYFSWPNITEIIILLFVIIATIVVAISITKKTTPTLTTGIPVRVKGIPQRRASEIFDIRDILTGTGLLRILVIIILIFLLFKPTYVIREKKTKPDVSLLIDTSASMKFGNRLKSVKKLLKDNIDLLEKHFKCLIYEFSTGLHSIDKNQLSKISARGKLTDIGNSLNQLLKETDRDTDGIILISDGQHNSTGDVTKVAESLNIPVVTLYPSTKKPVIDISVTDIRTSDFAFKNTPIEIVVVLRCIGLTGRETTIFLKKGKDIVANKKITITSNYQEVNFVFTPTRLGLNTYTVEVPPFKVEDARQGEETIVTNNHKKFNIEVVREKIRILYICGQPNPEYYFLRYLLKSDPGIELVSFVILRNPENIAVVPDIQLSLIPFPSQEIFTKDLFDFDILILENFNYTKFRIFPQYLKNIELFVRQKGGGFLMISGDNSFGKGGYHKTAVENILPVVLDSINEPVEQGKFNLRIVNPTHSIVTLADDPKESQKIWSELPSLDSCQKLSPKPGAVILAVHPWAKKVSKEKSTNLVAMACAEYGKGRTLAMGVNTTWRWALGMAEKKKPGGKHYTRFWKNAVKWLSHSEETKNFRISILQKRYFPGDELNLKLVVSDKSLKMCVPKLFVTDPHFRTKEIAGLVKVSSGWSTRFVPEMAGKYVFRARLEKAGPVKIKAEDTRTVMIAGELSAEVANLEINQKLMNKISELTGGKSYEISEFSIDNIFPLLAKKTQPIIKKQIGVWQSPIFYFVLLILLIGEWFIQRGRT